VAVALAGSTAPVSAALVSSTVSAALLSAAGQAAAAGVSPAVAALTEGVLRAMWMSELKVVAAVFLTVTLLAGGGGVLWVRLARCGDEARATTPCAPR
jgi:hypothetical protein